MKKPEPEIRDALWQNVGGQFQMGARAIIESRKPTAVKLEVISEILKVAYQSGLDRGYDLGFTVFGDGE